MSYEKPEVVLVASAVVAIQDPSEKSTQVMDADISNPNPASANAYSADE